VTAAPQGSPGGLFLAFAASVSDRDRINQVKVSVACRTAAFKTARYTTIGVSSGGADCQANDSRGGTILNASATCCRVPAR
jgi:hypothetical protein